MNILTFSKKTHWCDTAVNLIDNVFKTRGNTITHYRGDVGDPFQNPNLVFGDYDYIISYLSPWIIPKAVLIKAKCAINFHPGPADYPGTGCYNFALYKDAQKYGCVCHFMEPKVDTGEIVIQRLFKVFPHYTVSVLKDRTMVEMLHLLAYILDCIKSGSALVGSMDWKRRPYTSEDLEELKRITPDMPVEEVAKRVRATQFPGYSGATIHIGNMRFDFLGYTDHE